jgi:hypothetical protein
MKPFPGFDHLYELHDPIADRPFRGRFEHINSGAELSRAEASVEQPISVHWDMGSAIPSDVIWTTSAHPLIVSTHIINLLSENGCSGWTTYPVRVFNKRNIECPSYFGIAVTGRCGRIDLSKSIIALRQFPGGFFPEFRGHFFDPDSWDGSDFCMDIYDEKGKFSMQRIVTEDVVNLFKRQRITNIHFVRLSETSCSTSVYEIGLSYLLPPDFHARVAAAYREANVIPPAVYR